jgi:hypothetical protein
MQETCKKIIGVQFEQLLKRVVEQVTATINVNDSPFEELVFIGCMSNEAVIKQGTNTNVSCEVPYKICH